MPLSENCFSTSYLPLDIKDWLKEDGRLFGWQILIGCQLAACEADGRMTLLLLAVCLHQSSFLHRELYT
jgi:hypothetical protein